MREWLTVWPMLALISFGSPAVQLAAMHRILVDGKRWVSERAFLNALNYCFALPGPEPQLLATYIGWLRHRTIGGVVAGGLFILPGTICMLAMSYAYAAGGKSRLAEAVFYGIKPAVLVILVQSLMRIGARFLQTRLMRLLAGSAFVASYFFDLPFAWIVIASVLAGFISGLGGAGVPRFAAASPPGAIAGNGEEAGCPGEAEPAEQARPSAAGWFKTLVVWLAVWLLPVAAVVAIAGWDSVFGRIAVLFTEMTFVSVGGPYAVNAYVGVQAAETYGWLTHDEVIDGFAMAELAPGPAVQFLQFVGFLAAWRHPGALDPQLAGVLGALLAVWVTFVPTFLWMFLVAPFIELNRDSKLIGATLSALTAGTLGIILTFALRFGLGTLFSAFDPIRAYGFDFSLPKMASLDPWALASAGAAGLAAFQLRLGIVATLATGCAVGFLPRLLDPGLASSIRTALLGFVAGAAIGFPAGPLAVWCLHLRLQRRRARQWAIIVGSAVGDVLLAAGFLAIAGLFSGVLPALAFLRSPLVQGLALILSGIALFLVATRSTLLGLPHEAAALEPPKWRVAGGGLAFLVAVAASVTHPENLLTITAVMSVLGIQSDGGFALLAGFFLGSLAMWAGAIELLCRLGQTQGRQIMRRVMQLLCVLCVVAGIAQLFRWFNELAIAPSGSFVEPWRAASSRGGVMPASCRPVVILKAGLPGRAADDPADHLFQRAQKVRPGTQTESDCAMAGQPGLPSSR